MKIEIPTKAIIEWRLRQLFDLVEQSSSVAEIEDEIDDRIGQLRCDIANRAAVERGDIRE